MSSTCVPTTALRTPLRTDLESHFRAGLRRENSWRRFRNRQASETVKIACRQFTSRSRAGEFHVHALSLYRVVIFLVGLFDLLPAGFVRDDALTSIAEKQWGRTRCKDGGVDSKATADQVSERPFSVSFSFHFRFWSLNKQKPRHHHEYHTVVRHVTASLRDY